MRFSFSPGFPRILVIILATLLSASCTSGETLPFDRTHPVILTNDAGTHDVFMAEFALALNSRGDINLLGLVAEKVWRGAEFDDFENDAYPDLVAMAGRSGLTNLPHAYNGYIPGKCWTLMEPPSGAVDDTAPIESDGARFIKREVLDARKEKPIVIIAGGAVTSIASAYLMAVAEGKGSEFRDRVIVVADFGEVKGKGIAPNVFNLHVDAWAGYVVMKRLRTVLTVWELKDLGTFDRHQMFTSMPSSELSRFMHDKDLTNEWLPGNIVGDSQGIILLFHPEIGRYFNSIKRMSIEDKWEKIAETKWFPSGRMDAPMLKKDPRGDILIVGKLDPQYETNLFRDVFHDPGTFKGEIRQQTPYHGHPANLLEKLEAEHYDHGQEGVAYHDEAFSELQPYSASMLRMMERPDITVDGQGVYALAYLGTGEWEEYTVRVPITGEWAGHVRLSSDRTGKFSLEFRAVDTGHILIGTGPVTVPDTGGYDRWIDLQLPVFFLKAGTYVMRFINESPAARFEAETLQFTSNVKVEEIESPEASNGKAHLVKSVREGDFIEYQVIVRESAARLILGYKAGGDQGCVRLKVNDRIHTNRAKRPFVIDQFVWNPEWRTYEFGSLRLEPAGPIKLKFEVAEKNNSSGGLKMSIDYIDLQSEGPYKIDYFRFEHRTVNE